jgi:hypothetical protein
MQVPPVQGTELQQSPATVQSWPYSAQGGPASGGGGVTLPQMPVADPTARMQVVPTQQSASMVHAPFGGTQTLPLSGGTRQRKTPVPSGTQGSCSQQSIAEEQIPPAGTQAARPLQRGTPSVSS